MSANFEIVQYPNGPRAVRDGKVAVLYSPGYGAGWSTWVAMDFKNCAFDPTLVEMAERNASKGEMEAYVNVVAPGAYCGGLEDLCVQWMPIGTRFRVHEYDGSESIEVLNVDRWEIA